ncbi:MAG: type II toxin-antitoxin system VapC family toxin, partial [Gemmatimonadaceae bacterium]|nr:type II toxin-antitoxin system VapC family toxin [Gemmatimonadaceae bacterium]
IVLGQPGQLREWKRITTGVASGLIEVECLRTLDRLHLSGKLSAQMSAVRRAAVYRVIEALELVELTSAVLHRAAQPMPAPLRTLDAIHLATADMWRESRGRELVLATHDRALALGARAVGLQTIGV